MSSPTLAVAVLGAGFLGDRIADRIASRADLELTAQVPDAQAPPEGAQCVVYVPSFAEIAAGSPHAVLPRLLRDGYDVISTTPLDAHNPPAELREACRTGDSTYHATGAFQATIPGRLIRSLAEVTRDIRRVELVEELDLAGLGVHPWGTVSDFGIGVTDSEIAKTAAAVVDGYYTAGLRVLEETVFGHTTGSVEMPTRTVDVVIDTAGAVEKVIVERELGPLSYRSIWSAATDRAPLRYRLTTTTETAKGTANVRFRFTEGLHPADHLSCVNVMEAIRPVHERSAGIAHLDLRVDRLVPDERLNC